MAVVLGSFLTIIGVLISVCLKLTGHEWIVSIPVVGIMFAAWQIERRFRCPKCHQPIGEGPGIEILGRNFHWCSPWPAKHCRFCGTEIT